MSPRGQSRQVVLLFPSLPTANAARLLNEIGGRPLLAPAWPLSPDKTELRHASVRRHHATVHSFNRTQASWFSGNRSANPELAYPMRLFS
jgi:hypothetical protein